MADNRKIRIIKAVQSTPVVKKIAEKIEETKALEDVEKKEAEVNEPLEQQLPHTYEDKHEISHLKLFFIIVNSGQADAIVKLLQKEDVAACFIFSGNGTGTRDVYSVIGGSAKKQVVIAAVREDHTEQIIKKLNERFAVSRAAKGVAFSVKLTSIAGVSIYKFLSNTQIAKEKKHGRNKGK